MDEKHGIGALCVRFFGGILLYSQLAMGSVLPVYARTAAIYAGLAFSRNRRALPVLLPGFFVRPDGKKTALTIDRTGLFGKFDCLQRQFVSPPPR